MSASRPGAKLSPGAVFETRTVPAPVYTVAELSMILGVDDSDAELPNTDSRPKLTLHLVRFGTVATSAEQLHSELNFHGLKAASAIELLAYLRQFPNLERKARVAAIDPMPNGLVCVLERITGGGFRFFTATPDTRLRSTTWFLAVPR